jgi:hypothetical protein
VTLSRGLAIVLAAAVAVLPMAPLEHVHRREWDGHADVLIHRHLDLHHAEESQAGVEGVEGHAPLLTLSPTATAAAKHEHATPILAVLLSIVPVLAAEADRQPSALGVLIHGPPRASASPRAPPALPSA